MYRIRITNGVPGTGRATQDVVAQADVVAKDRVSTDLWRVHAQWPAPASWEMFDIQWEPGAKNLLRLVAIVAMQMAQNDGVTVEELFRRRFAYQPGCQVTVDMGSRHPEVLAWLDISQAKEHATYDAKWRVIGEDVPLTYKISYAPSRFDLWALLMRASVLLAVRKYAPRVGMCHG